MDAMDVIEGIGKFIVNWWGPILLAAYGIVDYFEIIRIPERFPVFIVGVVVIVVWAMFTFVKKSISEKEQNYIDAAMSSDEAVEELNRIFAKKGNTKWKEMSKVSDYGAHGTKSDKVWKMTFEKDGKFYVSKTDPKLKGRDSVVYTGKETAIFQPVAMRADANIEDISQQMDILKDRLRYKMGKPKKTKIKLEQTEEAIEDTIEKIKYV